MKQKISWTIRLDDGVKREVRVTMTGRSLRWQSKRSDEDQWVYDFTPSTDDWDALEDILSRRARRGRSVNALTVAQKLRQG